MRILFIGDMYGKSGRNALHKYLPLIKEKYQVDLTIANGENVTHGRGLNIKNYAEIKKAGVDFITMGNHTFDNEEVSQLLKNKPDIIRPLNLENIYDGDGSKVIEIKGQKIRISNVIGRVYVSIRGYKITNPFEQLEELIENNHELIHIVDFHGEATGEKKSFATYFDGRVSCVLGTHTHVQTADNQVLKNGTGYISDVGFCGAYESVLGVCNRDAIAFSKDQNFHSHSPALSDEVEFSAVYLDIDEKSGKCNYIKRIYLTPNKQDIQLLD